MRLYHSKRHSPLVRNNENAAIRYLKECEYKLKSANSRALIWFLGLTGLTIFFFILKFFLHS